MYTKITETQVKKYVSQENKYNQEYIEELTITINDNINAPYLRDRPISDIVRIMEEE